MDLRSAEAAPDEVAPVPWLPASERAKIIMAYQKATGYDVFIETGTGDGTMVAAVRGAFSRVVTIELNHHFYRHCYRRFANDPGVTCLWGDSGTMLWDVLHVEQRPAIFWLDAHYDEDPNGARGDKDTPIERELQEILNRQRRPIDVILIDDARFFGVKKDYPTLSWIEQQVSYQHNLAVTLRHDIIRIAWNGLALPDA